MRLADLLLNFPDGVVSSHGAALDVIRGFVAEGLSANLRAVLAHGGDGMWRPVCGRIDVAMDGDPSPSESVPRGPIRILEERVEGSELVERLDRAFAGKPLLVANEHVAAHGLDDKLYAHRRTSGWIQAGVDWPCFIIRASGRIPRPPHGCQKILDDGPVRVHRDFDAFLFHALAYPDDGSSLFDDRPAKFQVLLWDYRGRFDKIQLRRNKVKIAVSSKRGSPLLLAGVLITNTGEHPLAVEQPTSVEEEVEGDLLRVDLDLMEDDEVVAQVFGSPEAPVPDTTSPPVPFIAPDSAPAFIDEGLVDCIRPIEFTVPEVAGTRRLRILHISDLHERAAFEGMPPNRQAKLDWDAPQRGLVLDDRFYELLSEIGEGVDLVCFTGDVADWGHPKEYEKATHRLSRILNAVGVPPSRMFVVPGNHDVQRSVQREAWNGIRKWYEETQSGSALARWLASVGKPPPGIQPRWCDVLERLWAFWDWTEEFGCADIQPSKSMPLGYRHTFEAGTWPDIDVPVHIIGLDSAWLCGDEHDHGKIVVTDEQVLAHIRKGEHALNGFRIALLHHPISALADEARVWGLLANNGVDLLLHGHQHTARAREASDPDASLRTLAAGCLIEGDLGKNWPNGFQVIEVDVATKTYDIHFRKWARDASPGFWTKGSDIYRNAPDGVLRWGTPAQAAVRHTDNETPQAEPSVPASKTGQTGVAQSVTTPQPRGVADLEPRELTYRIQLLQTFNRDLKGWSKLSSEREYDNTLLAAAGSKRKLSDREAALRQHLNRHLQAVEQAVDDSGVLRSAVSPFGAIFDGMHELASDLIEQAIGEYQRRLKDRSEANCAAVPIPIVCIGPEVVAEGRRIAANGNRWTLRIDRFLVGDSSALCRFGDDIKSVPADQRYVLLDEEEATDARPVVELAWRKDLRATLVDVGVAPALPRRSVRELQTTDRHSRRVEGSAAAAALLRNLLETQWGQIEERIGTWLGEWLRHPILRPRITDLLRLDVARLACVPSLEGGKEHRPPLDFVERVISVTLDETDASDDAIQAEIAVKFADGEHWSGTVFVPTRPFDAEARQRALDGLLNGP